MSLKMSNIGRKIKILRFHVDHSICKSSSFWRIFENRPLPGPPGGFLSLTHFGGFFKKFYASTSIIRYLSLHHFGGFLKTVRSPAPLVDF
jgi:hypothetical protein